MDKPTQPKVSIIVPVFNAESYIERCINSILAQDYKDWELILVNDGSIDKSGKICDNFAKEYNQIKVIHKTNGGVSSARNLGLDNASGEWITFVDADDWIDRKYCSNLVSKATSPLSFVMSRHSFIDKEIKYINECDNISGEDRINFIISNNLLDYSGPYCKLFNNRIIKKYKLKFPENIHMGEDGIFLVKYLNVTKYLTVLNIDNYHYQNNNQSLSHRYFDFESEYDCYRIWKYEIKNLLKNKIWNNEDELNKIIWKNRIGDTFFRCILCLSRQNSKLSYKQLKTYLKSINENDWLEFNKYYIANTTQRKIVKNIFILQILLFDILVILIDRLITRKL